MSDGLDKPSRISDQNNRLRLKVTRIERSMEDLRKEKMMFAEKVIFYNDDNLPSVLL